MAPSRLTAALIGASLALTLSTAAEAQVSLGGNDAAQLALGVGAYDALHNYTAGEFRGEYRFGTRLWLLRPFVGVEGTTDGTVYGYGGFGLEILLGNSWVLTPNEAVGLWTRGDGKQLGNAVEFRSGAELDYELADQSRLGVSFHHISNAGLGVHNPGEEEIMLVYSLSLGNLLP